MIVEKIGEVVMEKMSSIDYVAYVRFASVYRAFKGIDEFDEFLNELKRMIDRETTDISLKNLKNKLLPRKRKNTEPQQEPPEDQE